MSVDTERSHLPPKPDVRRYVPDIANWGPLEALLGVSRCADFMTMGEANQNGITICLYKHRNTRRPLNIDTQGRTYRYNDGSYEPITVLEATHHAFT